MRRNPEMLKQIILTKSIIMNFHRTRIFIIGLSLLSIISCSEEEDPVTEDLPSLSSEKAITAFEINDTQGTIDPSERTVTLELALTDLSELMPTVSVSEGATVNPASGTLQDFTSPVTYTVTAEDESTVAYTVTVTSSIVSFTYNETNYEIVLNNLSWIEATAFAVNRGGSLARVNDAEEQEALFEALNDASIDTDNTEAPDGGAAAYVWIGGSDLVTEGNWIWDGDNDQVGDQFWQGLADGSPVGDLYTNWGIEPDDFGDGQDALGLALTDWPLGLAGQWNDIDHTNELYFVIELD